MTKAQYIEEHPKTKLADALRANNWPDSAKIEVSSGLIAPETKSSKLHKLLQESPTREYVVGGRRQAKTQGQWFAVRVG